MERCAFRKSRFGTFSAGNGANGRDELENIFEESQKQNGSMGV